MAGRPVLTLALLFLCTEAEGVAPCHDAPTLQTKVFQYR